MKRYIFLAISLLGIGCQKYMPVANSGADKVWMITADGTEVFRCWDLRQDTGKPFALCRRADMVGKFESTDTTALAEGKTKAAQLDDK